LLHSRKEKKEKNQFVPVNRPCKVIIDSSFFFIPSQFGIDIFEGLESTLNRSFEAIVLSTTNDELQRVACSRSLKIKRQAQIALKLTRKCNRLNVKKRNSESADDVIVRIASQMKCFVATNDSFLRRRLRRESVAVIFLRQKSHFIVEGAL
jgi:rRNA-processing protein FCF1